MNKEKKQPSSYSDFTLTDLQTLFGIQSQYQNLQLPAKDFAIPEWLPAFLNAHKGLPNATEKAKSETLITPVMIAFYEANKTRFNYFSGYTFDVAPEKALKGRCDYLLSKSTLPEIDAPVFGIFEAKDDNLEHWYGQCGAEMYAALLFNQERNQPYSVIHGAVSNGLTWQFLRFENSQLLIDTEYYTLSNLSLLLGTLQGILEFYG